MTIRVSQELKDWLSTWSTKSGLKLNEGLRQAIVAFREMQNRDSVALEPEDLQGKFLARVREVHGPHKAAADVGVSAATLEAWAEDPEFCRNLRAAKQCYLEDLQWEMHQIAIGNKRGDAQAAGWIQNAHNPAYGRGKKELILSILNPMVKKLIAFLEEELGAEVRPALHKAVERFQVELRKKLVGVT